MPHKSSASIRALGDLVYLIGLSGRDGVQQFLLGIALTATAALADAASLILLKNTISDAAPNASAIFDYRAAIAFILAAIIGSLLRLLAQHRTAQAQYIINSVLAVRAFRILQNQGYAEYLSSGASEGFTAFERLQLISTYGIVPFVAGSAASLGSAILLATIFFLYPAAAALIGLALCIILIEALFRSNKRASADISSLARERSRLIYEARTAFRDILLTNAQQRICDDFAVAEQRYRQEQSRIVVASQSSRHAIELCGLLTALAAVVFYRFNPQPDTELIPFLAVIALAALRLLPQVAMLRSALGMIVQHADVSKDTRALLKRTVPIIAKDNVSSIRLTRELCLCDIAFSRADRPQIFRNLNLIIPRGARIGISGPSGIGKSTLLDIICGATECDGGEVLIDETRLDTTNSAIWRERIGMVSQHPLLLGETLRDAVVYPQRADDIDVVRFNAAIVGASIGEMVASYAKGLDTPIGEAVAHLSGGQRQRLALAHALYRAQDILLLDEATGQLDDDSEKAIIAAIMALPRDVTIIISSHRPAIFECCDSVYRLEECRLVKQR